MLEEQVILVDAQDNELGLMHKQEAHQKGLLHRAFSVFLFSGLDELLLQRRAFHKYHSGGLWTNTCCSHPRPGEDTFEAATRRLHEEMGIDCELNYAFSFIYNETVGDLTEHELDHVFIGRFDGKPIIDQEEVADWCYISMKILLEDIHSNPENYTVWFRLCLEQVQRFRTEMAQ